MNVTYLAMLHSRGTAKPRRAKSCPSEVTNKRGKPGFSTELNEPTLFTNEAKLVLLVGFALPINSSESQ